MTEPETRQRQPWGIFLLFASMTALALITGAFLYYRHEEQCITSKRYEEIRSIASMKVAQIVAWREERVRSSKRNAFGPLFRQMVSDLRLQPSNLVLRGKIQKILQVIQAYETYEEVIVTDADGHVLLSSSGQESAVADERIAALAQEAIASEQPVFGEFTPCHDCPHIILDVAMAVAPEGDKPVAVLILRSDVCHNLYPLLKTWPIPSASAETVLVRRDGDRARVLSPHRDQSGPHLGQGIPLTQTELPVVQAALGASGLFLGRDFRGVEVMADLQAVPGSSWFMVAKIDRQEILAEAREHGWFIASLTGLSFLMTASLAAFLFSSRQRQFYRALYLAEQEKRRADATLAENATRLAKLNRIYIVLNAINQAIIRERKSQELFVEACRIAVDKGGFRMAWVGVLEGQTRRVLPVAQAGVSADYLEQLKISLDDSLRGLGPTATAFRSGKAVVANDIENDPSMEPWRENALQLGYRASASFPLAVGGQVVATFNLYSAEAGCFDQDEMRLLDEMVQDMAFAMEFMAQEKRRQAAERELRKFSWAIEQSSSSMIITDPQGAIEYVNPKFLSVTGYALEEVLGKNPSLLKSGETSAEDYQALWQTIATGGEWHGEFHNRKKDGTLFWERAAISPIRDEEGQITNFLAIKEDITHQKTLEEQLAQSQKMETVGRLAGGVAHDFNNMLGVILGCIELALDRVQVGDPLRFDLEEIRKAAQRSASLTRQLLAFARKQIAIPQILSLNSTIDSMLTMLQRLLGEDVSLVWRPGPELWPVKIDPSQVDQILANLTVNARDALARDGSLAIETANVALDEAYCQSNSECRPGDYVMLTISDTGAGMDQATLAHIFEPFFTTKGLGQGTGLGLATIYGIVKQNNGCIIADSELGVGTTFRIYLPRVMGAPAPQQDPKPDQQEAAPGSETVLLVEDEAAILQLGARILGHSGYTVLTATSPEQALALAASHPGPLQLLITDIVLPEMNGKELAEQVAALRPGVRTLFMSGYTADIIASHGVLETEISFIQKPFYKRDLLLKVRQVLDS